MKIVHAVLLITVTYALDHHGIYSWKRREDFKVAASLRSIAQSPIKVKETRSQRSPSSAQTTRRPRPSSTLKDDLLQSSASRRHASAEDTDEQQDLWSHKAALRTRQDLTRENRAIESTLKNVIGRPSSAKVEQYEYFSSFPYDDDVSTVDAILENADRPKNTAFSKDTEDRFLDHDAEEVDWDTQDVFEKDSQGREEEDEVNIQDFLNEIKRKRLNGELGTLMDGHRQGRRRKLTSQQQGALLVETLRKKRNHTINDHRGHSSNLQSGIMDMLGKSMFAGAEMKGKRYRYMCVLSLVGGFDRSERSSK